MKQQNKIRQYSTALLFSMGLMVTSCNYLDIVPPEQAGMKDAVSNPDNTEGFLYSCYGNVQSPINYTLIDASSADEYALPQIWGGDTYSTAYDLLTPNSSVQNWNYNYKYIGQTLLFLEQLPQAQGLTDNQRSEWEAEAWFLIAYYHFQNLRLYGPCPITDKRIPQETPPSEYAGRMHYDAVTNWIVDVLDERVLKGFKLPTQRDENTRGRATHAAACALKARVLLYAASPLWNGQFPNKGWTNTVESSYKGINYGHELVSKTYDPTKWERARIACEEAIKEAQVAGHKLYDDLELYARQSVPLNNIYIPGGADDEFKKRVMMLRYMTSSQFNEGNTEYIWGVSKDDDYVPYNCMMPYRVLQRSNGNWIEGYNSYSPFLGAVERFYTADGKFLDNSAPDLLQRANVDAGRPDIIKLAVKREPRFYAWIAYDQGDWGTMVADGKPVRLEFKDPNLQGFNTATHFRDHNVTGFLGQKFVRPNRKYDKSGNVNNTRYQRPLFRMAELYLSLAECYAMQNNVAKTLENLNRVHQRAGLPAITSAEVTSEHPLMSWVENERFVELYGEGHRFYDVRRWVKGAEYLSSGKREGLNAETITGPTFEQFNQRIKVNQPYRWTNRMYILPVLQSEIGKNTNLVQAPGY
ncbi:RagB/SusD family nutrient uptake outer membrane protein [Sphingobacterium sp.]|uniref:RagB/SusD family nutrient uptake outer membrane protein n=1 Tax=Sphingobacterium sp. TaxID=341027 RepID=UPI0031DF0E22